jgi:hypothetical protein
MSAFDRLPIAYRNLCHSVAKAQPPRLLAHRKVPISPQNRRVRLAADLDVARAKTFPNRVTRQQLRWAARK